MRHLFSRILALVLACLAVFSLTACGEKQEYLYQFDYTTADVSQFGSLPEKAYASLRVTLPSNCRYTKDTLDQWVEEVLEQYPSFAYKTDRVTAESDTVMIYYTAKVGKKVVKSHLAEGDTKPLAVRIAGNDYLNIEGFNDNLIGVMPGSDVTFTLTAPADYGNTDMRGKEVTVTATVVSIRESVYLTELNADYITDVLAWETEETEDDAIVAAFLAEAEKVLKAQAEENYEQNLQNEILKQLSQSYALKGYPTDDVNYQYNTQYAYYENLRLYDNQQYYMAYGESDHFPDLASYLRASFGLSADADPLQYLRALALNMSLKNMIVAAIFHQENMSISEEEFETRKQEIIDQYIEDGLIEEEKPEDQIDSAYINNVLMWEKVMEFLSDPDRLTVVFSA